MELAIKTLREAVRANTTQAIIAHRKSVDWCYSHMKEDLRAEALNAINRAKDYRSAVKILEQNASTSENSLHKHIVSNNEVEYCECGKPTLGTSVSRCGTCNKWFKAI